MTQLIHFTIPTGGERLDKLVHAHMPDLSRTKVQEMIENGQVLVNAQIPKVGEKARGGELVRIELPSGAAPKTDLTILHEDDSLLVVNKPANLVVHHGTRHHHGTLVDKLLARYPELVALDDEDTPDDRVGIVHRLDKDSSGLMVVARTPEALRILNKQFEQHKVDKYYYALLEKCPTDMIGTVDSAIARDPRRQRMMIDPKGHAAVTHYEVVDAQFSGGQALVRIRIMTGRTHQIRLHMASLGCPIVGDLVYASHKRRIALDRHFLHAYQLAFTHPVSDERLTFELPLPIELQTLLTELR